MNLDELDGRIGEGWAGETWNGSHINVVVARRASPTAAAVTAALGSSGPGHVPFMACLEVGTAVRPATVIVNKATMESEEHARITWGGAQLGIAQGVLDAVAEGLIDPDEAGELLLLVAVWVDPKANDETAVRLANRAAMRDAIADAVSPPSGAEARALAARREEANTTYYRGK